MVALFSTLLSNTNAADTVSTTSSSSIPTVIQLYTSTPLKLDTKTKLAGHAILSYQAVEVHAPSEEEEETTLFGRTRKTTSSSSIVETPNLGVWNAKVTSALVDSLLKIPSSPYYVMTVDLSDASQVEPTMTSMQEALVRYLIAYPSSQKEGSTSLYNLRDCTFGLAPEDTPPTTTAAPDETDRHVFVNLMICAIVSSTKKNNDYQETQAQNLVQYHLRRFAVAVGATLVFVSTSEKTAQDNNDDDEAKEMNDEDQATLTLHQLAHVWREFAQGNDLVIVQEDDDQPTAVYVPDKNPELMETVLLRNANCPPNWDASKDSLWKALPAFTKDNNAEEAKTTQSAGDDGWLQQLRDSLGTAAEPAAAAVTPTQAKTDDAEVSSFFENLLKK